MKHRKGQIVTTTETVSAYGSGYCGMPICTFDKGMIGRIVNPDLPPVTGRRSSFVLVEFWKPGVGHFFRNLEGGATRHNGSAWRVALWPEQVKVLPYPDLAIEP